MTDLNIVVMGKTGVGKSTLINSVFEKDVAATGMGQAVTKEVQVYSKTITLSEKKMRRLNLYDTVGLEIDGDITLATLKDIENILDKTNSESNEQDITTVWFCVNYGSSRFEDYEVDLIRNLSIEYEIPFMIVITQCVDETECELEQQIRNQLPEVTTVRILAKDYKLRGGGLISSFGVAQLIEQTVYGYANNRVKLLESKLDSLEKETTQWYEWLANAKSRACICVSSSAESAQKIGWAPGICIPFVHGICIKMLNDLDDIFGIHTTEGFAADIFANVVVGIVATPFMTIPVLSGITASAYVESVGERYVEALESVLSYSSYSDLANKKLMAQRIRDELIKHK